MGTECNSDSVGKTDSYCVVIPAGMWELNAIVTVWEDRHLLFEQDGGFC